MNRKNKVSTTRKPNSTKPHILGGEDIVAWATSMGYPGANSEEFKKNAGRLVTPQLRTMWSHLMKHVKPANEVADIKRQILEYKRRFDNNASVTPSKKFKSVADYEAFCKSNSLKANMKYCDDQTEMKQDGIKTALTKFQYKGEQRQYQKAKEKEALEKIRLLGAKQAELKQQVASLKQLGPLLDHFKQPNYSFKKSQASDSWLLEVQGHCLSLERGREISQICEQTEETLKNMYSMEFKFTSSENEETIFKSAINEYHAGLAVKHMELREKRNTLFDQVEAKKQNMLSSMQTSGDLAEVARADVLKLFLKNRYLENVVGKTAEMEFLERWIVNNRTELDRSLNSSYIEGNELIAELDNSIKNLVDEISIVVNFPFAERRNALISMITKMKTEAAAACDTEEIPDVVIHKILSELPQLIKHLKKTSVTDKKMDLGTQSIQAYTELKSSLSRTDLANAVSLDISLDDQMSGSVGNIIELVDEKVLRDKSVLRDELNNLTGIINEIDDNLQYIDGHLACWENGSPTDVICNNADYQDLLRRLKNADME